MKRAIEQRLVRFNSGTMAHMIRCIAEEIHERNFEAGWWSDLHTGEPKERNVGEVLMLCVSELSEAFEGHRKQLKDDHLPDRPAFTVELVDTLIRIFDLLGSPLCADPGGAFLEKLEYNRTRQDHSRAARMAPGGKTY